MTLIDTFKGISRKKYGLAFSLMWSNPLLVINCVTYLYELIVVTIE